MNKTIILLISAWLILAMQTFAQSPSADSLTKFYTGGIRINNTHPFGVAGITVKWSNTLYQFIGFDLGGRENAKQTAILIRILHSPKDGLFLFTGPSVESILPDPTAPYTVDYLCASSGILWSHRWSAIISSWIGISYLTNQDMRHPIKIGLGISVPIILKD